MEGGVGELSRALNPSACEEQGRLSALDGPFVLGVREFAQPVPRSGSIEPHSGYGNELLQLAEIHRSIQKQRLAQGLVDEIEVPLSGDWKRDGWKFRVHGRADGFLKAPCVIEEVKVTFNPFELKNRLRTERLSHPYVLQLFTYGYLYFLQYQVVPELVFQLVSSRNPSDREELSLPFDLAAYEFWLDLRLEQLVQEAQRAVARTARRKQAAQEMAFPFEKPRKGQKELIEFIEKRLGQPQRLWIQAPTGLGKTVGVLYPLLKEALNRGAQTVYVTPKNSQHAVAEEAIARLRACLPSSTPLHSLTLTAKSKLCLKPEPLCQPDYCEFAKDHYSKVDHHELVKELSQEETLGSAVFKRMGEVYRVCPYELQMELLPYVDSVIGDYNYAFSPGGALGRMEEGLAQGKRSAPASLKPNLVIDEAHNLPGRAMDYYSPTLSSFVLEKMREDIRALPDEIASEVEKQLDRCLQVIVDVRPQAVSAEDLSEQLHLSDSSTPRKNRIRLGGVPSVLKAIPVDAFEAQEVRLKQVLSKYLDTVREIGRKDVVLRLCFYWA
jgi:DNA excision repair protein ERCC-2